MVSYKAHPQTQHSLPSLQFNKMRLVPRSVCVTVGTQFMHVSEMQVFVTGTKKKSEFQREVLWIPNKIWSFTGAMPDVSEGNVTLAELRGF